MAEYTRTFQFGAATISILNLGTLQIDLAGWLGVPEQEWPPEHADALRQPLRVPAQCILIALPDTRILVDACDAHAIGQSSFAPPEYQPHPDLTTQLRAVGTHPDDIDHVVLTHCHFDHYSGVAQAHNGQHTPLFPQARHYLGRADWHKIAEPLADPESLESRTLGMLHKRGLLDLVDDAHSLGDAVRILPTPGETPGHQIVRVQAADQFLYCLGDLYHHPVEFVRPAWMPYWADEEATHRSRAALTTAALAEDALLLATHIPGVGRLQPTSNGVIWQTAE